MKLGIQLIDLIRGTDILDRYHTINNIQQDQTICLAIQTANLRKLLFFLKGNKYYKPYLHEYTLEDIENTPFKILKAMPIVDKQIMNSNYDSFFTKIKGIPYQQKKTGGSTGTPFYYYVDKAHLSWFWAHIFSFWNTNSGYEPGDPFITIAGNSLRTYSRKATENIYYKLQNNYFIKGDIIDSSIRIDYAKIRKAKHIYGYPSSIIKLIREKPQILKFTYNLNAIYTTSEQLQPQVRNEIETSFGKPVFDMYGANDGGILTCECSEHNGYHINMLNCFVETFENEFGMSELILTNLNSYTFPFVRYRVGDLGIINKSSCKCGNIWPKISELKGRVRDLIKLPHGKSVHGSFFNKVFFKYPLIDGYKIVQAEDYSIIIFIHVKEKDIYNQLSKVVMTEIQSELGNIIISTEFMPEFNPTNSKFKLIESHAI